MDKSDSNTLEDNAWSLGGGVIVSKENLLNALEENKKKHDEIYLAAAEEFQENITKYGQDLVRYYREQASYAKLNGNDVSKHFLSVSDSVAKVYGVKGLTNIPDFQFKGFESTRKTPSPPQKPVKPLNYESEYLAAIQKVKISSHDQFRLNESEFKSFIMNDWSWKQQFLASTAFSPNYYSSTGSLRGTYLSGIASNF